MVGKNPEPVVLGSTTVERFKAANEVTKTVTTFTKTQIENAIQTAINLAKQATQELYKTDSGEEVATNKYFIRAKNIGKGIYDLCAGVYAGLEVAFTTVAQDTKLTTESVLEHKYGPDVRDVFSHTTDAAWEVYSMRGIVKKQALRAAGKTIKEQLKDIEERDQKIFESTMLPTSNTNFNKPGYLHQEQLTPSQDRH